MEKHKGIRKEWEVTANRFVAFIDVMGFTDMVMRMNSKDIHSMMKTIHDLINSNHAYLVDEDDDSPHTTLEGVRSSMFSDSIMLYTENDSEKSFRLFVMAVAGVISNMYVRGIPFKGAIAHGELVADDVHSIYFGQPIIDAYYLQNEVKYYGIVCHATAEREFINFEPLAELISYNCPLERGSARHFVVVPAPIYFLVDEYNMKLIQGVQEMKMKTSGHLRRYIENTEEFLVKIFKLMDDSRLKVD